MLVPGHPSCPWGYRDHVSTIAAAKTEVGLLFRAPLCSIVMHKYTNGTLFHQYERNYIAVYLYILAKLFHLWGLGIRRESLK
jgi:hypothetical protein